MSRLDGAPLTRAIITVTVVVTVLSWMSIGSDWLFENLAYFGPYASQGEVWRMFTPVLLHARGFLHIGFNMYALYLFGPAIERSLGKSSFAVLYLSTAIFGSLAVYLISPPQTVAIGASGAIFGLLGMWVYRAYRLRDTKLGQAQLRQYGIMIALNAAIPLFVPSVAWEAHVGGFLGGAMAAVVMAQIKDRRLAAAVVAMLGIVAMVIPLVFTPL